MPQLDWRNMALAFAMSVRRAHCIEMSYPETAHHVAHLLARCSTDSLDQPLSGRCKFCEVGIGHTVGGIYDVVTLSDQLFDSRSIGNVEFSNQLAQRT